MHRRPTRASVGTQFAHADCSIGEAILLPVSLSAIMAVIGEIAITMAQIDAHQLLSYFACAAVTMMCVLCFLFLQVATFAIAGADHPVALIKHHLADRWALMILPSIILPIFLMGYTAAKCAIPHFVGYTWDTFWANADHVLFGDDAWRIARRVLGTSHEVIWEWCYSVGWITAFLVLANGVAFYGKRRFVGIYFTALLGTWLVGGCLMAYAFSAAGPVFAPLYDSSLAERFKPIWQLMNSSVAFSPIATSQHYLETAARNHLAAKGGGISAMPSMHIGTVSIFVLAARRTKWLSFALLFWVTIFLASGYFGYHYWVDGIVAALVATGCWLAAEALYSPERRLSLPFGRRPQLQSIC